MSRYNLIATSAFGIESVVAQELKDLGFTNLKTDNGKVTFEGDEHDIVKCNLHLRCADRLLIKMSEFKATDFEELYQGVLKVKWEDFIPVNGKMHIVGKSVKSKLFSVSDCQSITKKAVIEAMKRKYKNTVFKEDGPVYKIEIAFLKDIATLTIDTSGKGLHKRGYRLDHGEAPLRETLAAAMIKISRWRNTRVLADPFCGSGTIAIEAALIGKNIAPGLYRDFVAETWPNIPTKIWTKLREEAKSQINDCELDILASDSDLRVLRKAKENAANFGLENDIVFQKKPLSEFSSKKKFGCIICNPPYGERIGEKEEAEQLYEEMGEIFTKLDTWSYFILTSFQDFPKYFGKESSKNRKLYNGKLKVYLHQYFGPLPPRKKVV